LIDLLELYDDARTCKLEIYKIFHYVTYFRQGINTLTIV